MSDQKREGSQLFQCDICHYNTLVESCYEKHLLSAKHMLLTAEADAKVYRCDPCDYVTIKKSCYDRHLTTTKHKLESRVIKNSEGKLVCNYCSKVYNSRPGLWEHRKKCSSSKKSKEDAVRNEEEDEKDGVKEDEKEEKEGEKEVSTAPPPLENTIVFSFSPTKVSESASETACQPRNELISTTDVSNNIIMQLFNQNQEFRSLMVEQQRENKDLINKLFEMTQQNLAMTTNITNNTINNNNQRFNLNVFLNETCKDAMNLDEFLDTIRPTFDELLVMGDVGFVSGISDIFIKRLRALDITKRPIHCTDAKRETIFLKENNVWTKDDNGHSRLNSIIEKVEYRNVVCLHQWCLDNPDAMVNNHEKNLLRDKIYLQTLLGDPKTREKVVRNIAKEVALDREAIMLQFGRK